MAITNFSNYVFSPSTSSVPSININWKTSTAEAITAAITAYEAAAAAYVANANAMLTARENVRGKFMKDICAEVSLALINKQDNTYVINQKANEFYEEAIVGKDLSNANGLSSTYNNFKRLVLNLFVRDDFSGTDVAPTDLALPTTEVANQAEVTDSYVGSFLTLACDSDGSDYSLINMGISGLNMETDTENALFLQENLAASGTAREFANYTYDSATYTNTKAYLIKNSGALNAWGLYEVENDTVATVPVATTVNIDENRNWTQYVENA